MDDNGILEYFRTHKLSPTGIRNFLAYCDGAREYVDGQVAANPEFRTPGGYINCLVRGITLPKCVICGKPINYKSFMSGHTHCSMKCFAKDKDVVEGRNRTNMERYGVSNPSQVKEFKDRRSATIMDRYGVDSILKNPAFVKKQKQTMIDRYGVDSYQKTDQHKRKAYDQSYETILGWGDYVRPLFTREEYHGWKHGQVYRWKCMECGGEFESDLHVSNIHGIERLPRCMKCHPYMTNESELERDLKKFIESLYDGEIVMHERNIVNGIELDIYLPDRKLAFEFDGLYYHNEFSGKSSDYHRMKTEKCEAAGIHLIHVFEDEWLGKREIVEDRIRCIMGIGGRKVFARKCVVDKIDDAEASVFLEHNHLQGNDHSSVKYGLYYEGELVAVMTFGKPRFNKNYNWELIRFACKIGVNVIGGASRLLSRFSREHQGTLISYADRRYSIGLLYKALGFELVGKSEPNYWWVKNKVRISRYKCQKSRLQGLLGDKFDESKSEVENMHTNGWGRIYDCGNFVFVKKLG